MATAPLVLVIYPLASLAATVLNLFGHSESFFVETLVMMEKQVVPVAVASRSALKGAVGRVSTTKFGGEPRASSAKAIQQSKMDS